MVEVSPELLQYIGWWPMRNSQGVFALSTLARSFASHSYCQSRFSGRSWPEIFHGDFHFANDSSWPEISTVNVDKSGAGIDHTDCGGVNFIGTNFHKDSFNLTHG